MQALDILQSWTLSMKDRLIPILAGLQHQIDNWRLDTSYKTETDRQTQRGANNNKTLPPPQDGQTRSRH